MSDRCGVLATRRAALGGALAGVLVVAACDLDKPAPTSRPTAAASAAPDADQRIVDEARSATVDLLGLVRATAVRHAGLARDLAALRAMHRAHLALLEGEDAPTGPAPSVPAVPAAALAALRRSESRAQSRLADWSVAADSGALARLLAGMSASVAQHLAALPAAPGRPA